MKFKVKWTQTYVYSVEVEAPSEAAAKKVAKRIDRRMTDQMAERAEAIDDDEEDDDDNADLFEPVVVDGVEYEVSMDIVGGIETLKVEPIGQPPRPRTAGLRLVGKES